MSAQPACLSSIYAAWAWVQPCCLPARVLTLPAAESSVLLTANTAATSICPACLSVQHRSPCVLLFRGTHTACCTSACLHVQACCLPIPCLSQVTVDDRVLEKLTIDEMKDIVAADPTQAFTVNEAEAKVS